MRGLPLAILAALGLLAASCGSKSSSGSSPDTTCTQADGLTYTAGMAVAGTDGNLKLALLLADPAPPAEVFGNAWEMQVYPATGSATAIAGCTVGAVASMPQMGHLTNPEPTVTASGSSYDVTPINFFMDGLWQVTFTLSCPSGNATLQDTVNYHFCIED